MENAGLEFALNKTAFNISGLFKAAPDVLKQAPERMNSFLKAIPFGTKAMMSGLGMVALKKAIDKIRNDINRKALIEQLMEEDPVLKQEDPEKILEYYATINMFAPHVSKDKNVVRELLTNFVRFGRVDFATIEALVKTEDKLKGGKSVVPNMLGLKDLAEGLGEAWSSSSGLGQINFPGF